MVAQIELPDCMMTVYKQLFPTLDWTRISFHLGIKRPFKWGEPNALTLPGGISRIQIYIREDEYQPCTQRFFLMIAHELVHALQIQDSAFSGKGLGFFNFFAWKFLTCYTKHYDSADRENPYEEEAYEYERKLKRALEHFAELERLPCSCSSLPLLSPNLNFIGVDRLQETAPDIIKRKSDGGTVCRGRVPSFGFGPSAGHEASNGFGWILLGTIIGAFFGPVGAIIGALIGAVVAVIDYFTGIPSGMTLIGVVVVGAIIDGVAALITSIKEWLSPGDRPVKLLFSTDGGLSFGDELVIASSSEPPALAFGAGRIFVAWTDAEHRVNIFSAPSPNHASFKWSSNDSGPALCYAGRILFVAWQQKKNRVVTCRSANFRDFTSAVRIGGKQPDDATPGLAFGNSKLHIAWVRKSGDNAVGMKSSSDNGDSWGGETTLDARSRHQGSAALAYGNGRLFLAWATRNEQRLHVRVLAPQASGPPTMVADYNLDVRCRKDTGPAITFGGGRVFVAWVGRGEQRLRIRSFDVANDGSLTEVNDTTLDKRAKDNAGPALAYGLNTLCIAWVRKNR